MTSWLLSICYLKLKLELIATTRDSNIQGTVAFITHVLTYGIEIDQFKKDTNPPHGRQYDTVIYPTPLKLYF